MLRNTSIEKNKQATQCFLLQKNETQSPTDHQELAPWFLMQKGMAMIKKQSKYNDHPHAKKENLKLNTSNEKSLNCHQ